MRKQEEQSRNTNQDLYLHNNVDVVDHQLGSGHDDDDDKDNDIDRPYLLALGKKSYADVRTV